MGSSLAVRVGSPGFGESVVVVRVAGGGDDDWGDPLPGVEMRTSIDGCAVAPLKSDESASIEGPRLIDGFTVYAPLGADIASGDVLEVRGGLYHVDGAPGVWMNPYSAAYPSGVEAICRRA